MRFVTPEEVLVAMVTAGITEVNHHRCACCNAWVRYRRDEGNLFFDSNCDCSSWSEPTHRSWHDAAEFLNNFTDAKYQAEALARFGIQPEWEDRPPKWARGQALEHVKTGKKYAIISIPRKELRLEYNNQPFYTYRSFCEDTDHMVWHRCQSEMEDGRFIEKGDLI